MWGRGPRGNHGACSALVLLSVTSPATRKQIGSFWCWFPGVWVVYILGPSGSLQRTLPWGWEFLPPLQPPQLFIARGFEALVFRALTLGCMVCFPPQLFLLAYLHANVEPPGLPPCHACSSAQLPISAPPIGLDECFFFNSLVVRLPYNSIFW